MGMRSSIIQIRFQKGVLASGITGIADIMYSVIKVCKTFLLVGSKIVNQSAMRQLSASCQTSGEGCRD